MSLAFATVAMLVFQRAERAWGEIAWVERRTYLRTIGWSAWRRTIDSGVAINYSFS